MMWIYPSCGYHSNVSQHLVYSQGKGPSVLFMWLLVIFPISQLSPLFLDVDLCKARQHWFIFLSMYLGTDTGCSLGAEPAVFATLAYLIAPDPNKLVCNPQYGILWQILL